MNATGTLVRIADGTWVAWRERDAWWIGEPSRRALVSILAEDGKLVESGRLALEPAERLGGGAVLVRVPDGIEVEEESESEQ